MVYTFPISLNDALSVVPLEITTLDGRKLLVPNDQIVNPTTAIIVADEGFPLLKSDVLGSEKQRLVKGDLIVRFDIQFPTFLSEDQKTELESLLA